MDVRQLKRCEVCAVILLNGNSIRRYCDGHGKLMARWNLTMKLIKSDEFKVLPWEYKKKILHAINFPNHKNNLPGTPN